MLFWHVWCPNCRRPIDSRLWHICTGLGPKIAICPKCRTQVSTGRREWDDFSGARRGMYWFLTALYAFFFAALGVGVGHVLSLSAPSLGDGLPVVYGVRVFPGYAAGVLFALLVAVLQFYRLNRSRKRSAAGSSVGSAGIFNLQVNIQRKLGMLFVLALAAAGAPYVYREIAGMYAKVPKGAPAPSIQPPAAVPDEAPAVSAAADAVEKTPPVPDAAETPEAAPEEPTPADEPDVTNDDV